MDPYRETRRAAWVHEMLSQIAFLRIMFGCIMSIRTTVEPVIYKHLPKKVASTVSKSKKKFFDLYLRSICKPY